MGSIVNGHFRDFLSPVIFTGVPESVDRIWGAETEPLTTGLSPERRLVGFN
jgi:hypothetical protein